MIESPAPVLYERILGSAFSVLPAPLQELHSVVDFARFAGRARIEVGTHPLASLVRRLMRFPAAAEDTVVEVTMQVDGQRERWTRRFGDARFVSVLRWPEGAAHGAFVERFGPFSFDVQLIADGTGIGMPVHRARFLGLPLPRWLTPESRTREFVDESGRACFDVEVLLPGIGRMVRYSGWLKPVGSDPSMPPI